MLFASCGGDDLPEPQVENTITDDDAARPTIDDASVSYDASLRLILFKASCPANTNVKVLLRQLTNGTTEKLLEANYNSSGRQYYIQLKYLLGGTEYAFCVVGYDSKGREALRTTERTFTTPKDEAPDAPITSGIKTYPPSAPNLTDGYITGSVITEGMEYSMDNGRTWLPVTEKGIIRNLRPGDVLLRWAETPTTHAGKTATVTVPSYVNNIDLDGTNGTSQGLYVRRPHPRK